VKSGVLWLSLLLLFGVYSCGSMRRIQTRNTIETITKIDTVIKVKVDTMIKKVTVYFHDSARIENHYSIARSYYDTTKQKIVLTLQAKPFSIPVLVNQRKTEVQETKETDRKQFIIGYIMFLIILIFIIAALVYILIKLLKPKV
jgi:hypothetical protein